MPRFIARLPLILLPLLLGSAPLALSQTNPAAPDLFLSGESLITAATIDPPAPADHVQFTMVDPGSLSLLQAVPDILPLRLTVNLCSNEQHVALFDRRQVPGPGRVVWRGALEGMDGSQVILGLSHDALAGSVSIPGRGVFQIQHAGSGWQRIREVTSTNLPPCATTGRGGSGDDVAAESPLGTPKEGGWFTAADETPTNTVMDLLVVYTSAARDGAGGTDGMTALIDVAVTEANEALENSLTQASLRLVQSAEVDYVETGDINQDLNNLEEDDREEEDDAPPLRGVHPLRRQYLADLVCLITENTGGPLGLANVMREVDVEFSEKAFSVVQRQYANTYYALAHEVGHNLGCQHDRATSSSDGCFSYSHAHLFTAQGLRYHTIMAYQPGLPVPYFSNPDVSYLGEPTGVPEEDTDSADNARTIRLTAPTVARFSSLLLTGAPPSLTLVFPTNGATTIGPTLTLSVQARDPDGQVAEVSFYLDGEEVAEMYQAPFILTLTNMTAGWHVAAAAARDDTGWRITSAPAFFNVAPAPPAFDRTRLRWFSDGRFQMNAIGNGSAGRTFRVDASTNLTDWLPVATNLFSTTPVELTDPDLSSVPARFYRVVVSPSP